MTHAETDPELAREVAAVKHGSHLCLVYDSPAEQLAAVLPYVNGGRSRGERCVYLADERAVDDVARALESVGVDAAGEARRGALLIQTKRDAYHRAGRFDPQAMVAFLRETTDAAVRDGWSGLLVTGEMSWALGPEPGNERLIEYECLLNQFFPTSKAHAICQYHRRRFSPEIVRDVLRTHPTAIVGGLVCPNPFYEPPDMALGRAGASAEVEWRIAQLERARESRLALEGSHQALRRREAELSRALQARDEFLAVASHELRTPLTSLQLQIQAVKRKLGSADAGERALLGARVDGALRQAHRLAGLIADLLDVSRLGSGQLRLRREDVDLSALAREVVTRASEARSGVPIRLHADAPVVGRWDPVRIDQVLTNLIENAVKYGGEEPVEVRVGAHGGVALLEVQDQGIGFDEASRERIFERFERAVPVRHYGGLGLGLFLARRIVESHGGTIEAKGEPGRGATFTVRLPREAAAEGAARPPLRS